MDINKILAAQKIFYKELNKRAETLKSSDKMGLKYCNRCGRCCMTMPCDFNKEDIKNVAEYLEITEKELFNNYLTIAPFKENIYTITPIGHNQKDLAGRFKEIIRMFDLDLKCIFLKMDKDKATCTIHDAKSKGGRVVECWEKQNIEQISIQWTQADIAELLNSFK